MKTKSRGQLQNGHACGAPRLTRCTTRNSETPARRETDEFGKTLYGTANGAVIDAVARIAESRCVPRAQVALAWILQKPGVTSPILGATKHHHISDAVAALDIILTAEEIRDLESGYTPQPVQGHI